MKKDKKLFSIVKWRRTELLRIALEASSNIYTIPEAFEWKLYLECIEMLFTFSKAKFAIHVADKP